MFRVSMLADVHVLCEHANARRWVTRSLTVRWAAWECGLMGMGKVSSRRELQPG